MRLFPKVFLWFWLAMALVIGALFVTTELPREREPFPAFSGMDRAMDAFARLAAETFEREGRGGSIASSAKTRTSSSSSSTRAAPR